VPVVTAPTSALSQSASAANLPEAFPEPARPANVDPAQVLSDLASMRPFNSNDIDLNRIARFLNAYQLLAGNRPDVAGPIGQTRAVMNELARMSTFRVYLTSQLTIEAIDSMTTHPRLFAMHLLTIVRSTGAIYQDFVNNYGDRLGDAQKESARGQVTGSSPMADNIRVLNELDAEITERVRKQSGGR
jgi:hypothetical protein